MSKYSKKTLNSILEADNQTSDELYNILVIALSNTYLLYIKTQNFHWNVTGNTFFQLHKLFQEQYEDLADAVDLLAEQIRQLGKFTPGSMKQFLLSGTIMEELNPINSNEMLTQLIDANNIVVDNLNTLIEAAYSVKDEATADVGIERLRVHKKAIWFLKSHLQ